MGIIRLVRVKCTQCGAKIKVDKNQATNVCPHCSATFSRDIETINEQNNSLQANSNKSKDNSLHNKNLKAILPLFISFGLIFVIAFISFTYSWIFSTYFSAITGVNISIADSQGLIMILNDEVTSSIDINSYIGGAFSTFSLKEASSSNGRDLFLRDSGSYYNDVNHLYDAIPVAKDNTGIIRFRQAESNDENDSFIYFYLKLQATGYNRYLVFDPNNSYIKDNNNNLIDPVRVSLSFDDGSSIVTKIVGNRQEYVGNYTTQAVNGIDSVTKVGFVTNQNVDTFAGYSGYTAGVFDQNKTLYYLQDGILVNVVVRIWLEGGDPLCTNQIAASSLDISLAFDNIQQGA